MLTTLWQQSIFDLGIPILALLIAGVIKGMIGLGLPTTALAIMTLSTNPRQAIAYILIPMIASNAWQIFRSGEIKQALKRYAPFIVAMVVSVWVTVNLSIGVSDQFLLGALGSCVVLFSIISSTAWAPYIPERFVAQAQIIFGAIAGIMGGLTSVWAPPMAMYLSARGVEKTEFVRASGLLIFFGSLPLGAGFFTQRLMLPNEVAISAILLVPTFLGYTIGEMMRNHIDQRAFKKIFLGFFLIIGLNMIRQALL